MLTISEIYRYKVPESPKIIEALKKKRWEFEKEVGAIIEPAFWSWVSPPPPGWVTAPRCAGPTPWANFQSAPDW